MSTYHTTSNNCEEGSGTIGSTYNDTRDGPTQQDAHNLFFQALPTGW